MRIEDHALIGDLHTAALVDREGSIDWLCLPRFDSGAVFAALLGEQRHGHWSIRPAAGTLRTSRRYRSGTLVLETTFETEHGSARVIDLMPIREVTPTVVRVVEGISGSVQMRMHLVPRFEYGFTAPWLLPIDGGAVAYSGPNALYLYTHLPLGYDFEDFSLAADFLVREGESVPFTLAWQSSFEDAPLAQDALTVVTQTESWWREWSSRCAYDGEWHDQVLTSFMTLKALTYRPTGAVLAAPTTSLPEQVGGERNWDYRFCWLRDAALVMHAMEIGGYVEEQDQYTEWLLRAISGPPEQATILYGIDGERWLPEQTLDWLDGYEGSAPVRVGNAAATQFQLDVFGEAMDAAHYRWAKEGRVARPELFIAAVVPALAYVEKRWHEPDEGIWEVRGPRRHFTYSRVMAWVAFDRGIDAVERLGAPGGPVERWRQLRDEIHKQVCRDGYDPRRRTFTQYYGSHELDASALLIPAVGFLPPDDERVVGTVEAVERELTHDGLVYRYSTESGSVDGLSGSEGAFLPCSFWLVDALAMIGRRDDARELFGRLLALANDVGLLAEEYDPRTGRQLGNFPQAFSHLALVNTAATLSAGEVFSAARYAPARTESAGAAGP